MEGTTNEASYCLGPVPSPPHWVPRGISRPVGISLALLFIITLFVLVLLMALQVIRLCRKHFLFTPLIHLHTRAIMDFVSPAADLLACAAPSSHAPAATREAAL